MKSILLIFCMCFALNCIAQNYVPFPENDVMWNCSHEIFDNDAPDDHWSIIDRISYVGKGDTIIGGTNYHKVTYDGITTSEWTYPGVGSGHDPDIIFGGYFGCYRNDIANKKVWFIPKDSTSERLLYDFNLSVGDTIRNWWSKYHDCYEEPVIVQSIDSTLILNSYRKRFHLSSIISTGNVLLIEGIGSTAGIFSNLSYNISDTTNNLNMCNGILECHSILPFRGVYPDSTIWCSDVIGINELDHHPLQLYPNPSIGKFELNNIDGPIEVCIFNLQGIQIYSSTINENQLIDLTDYPTGLYLCKFIYKDQSASYSKIIKE